MGSYHAPRVSQGWRRGRIRLGCSCFGSLPAQTWSLQQGPAFQPVRCGAWAGLFTDNHLHSILHPSHICACNTPPPPRNLPKGYKHVDTPPTWCHTLGEYLPVPITMPVFTERLYLHLKKTGLRKDTHVDPNIMCAAWLQMLTCLICPTGLCTHAQYRRQKQQVLHESLLQCYAPPVERRLPTSMRLRAPRGPKSAAWHAPPATYDNSFE